MIDTLGQDVIAHREMCTRVEGPEGEEVIVECNKLIDNTCSSYARPYNWFRRGGCPLCSIPSKAAVAQKGKVNALKASKRSARGK